MFADEHYDLHVHVQYNEHICKIDLATLNVVAGQEAVKQIKHFREAMLYLRENKEEVERRCRELAKWM